MLDAGAGPLSTLGSLWTGVDWEYELIPVDALSVQYKQLYAKYGVVPPVATRLSDFEEIDNVFPQEYFDLVHVKNALDHSYDPMAGLHAMLRVCKRGSMVFLAHVENEAERENYQGMHQWNFARQDGRFVIWSQAARHDVAAELCGNDTCTVDSELDAPNNFIRVYIRKL